jgi:UMF1 family MFS transporter
MYDWANSAFQTTVITGLAGPYLAQLAQHEVGPNGVIATLGPLGSITALSLFPYCISVSVFLQVLLLPVLGAIADYSRAKKRLMAAFLRERHPAFFTSPPLELPHFDTRLK